MKKKDRKRIKALLRQQKEDFRREIEEMENRLNRRMDARRDEIGALIRKRGEADWNGRMEFREEIDRKLLDLEKYQRILLEKEIFDQVNAIIKEYHHIYDKEIEDLRHRADDLAMKYRVNELKAKNR